MLVTAPVPLTRNNQAAFNPRPNVVYGLTASLWGISVIKVVLVACEFVSKSALELLLLATSKSAPGAGYLRSTYPVVAGNQG